MGSNNSGFNYLCYPPETDKDAQKKTKQEVYKNLLKFVFSILIFFLVFSTCYFSEVNATNEENFLKKLHGNDNT